MRQLLLERRYDLLVEKPSDDGPPKTLRAVARALDGFEFGAVSLSGLRKLLRAADRVLVRADGMVFNVAVITVVGERGAACERLSLDELVTIGQRFTDQTGKVHGNRVPVVFQLFEIFADGIPDAFVAGATGYRRRGVSAPKVGIGVVAIDARSGRTWSNYPGLVRWVHESRARRAWRDRGMSRETRDALLAKSGFQIEKALLGSLAGSALGIAATWVLLQAREERGELYGGAIVLASLVASVISLKSCRVVHATVPQAAVAGGITAAAVLAAGYAMGLGVGLGTAMTVAVALFVSFALGVVDNPQGRKR